MTVYPELCGNSTSYPDLEAVVPLEYSTEQKVMSTAFENGTESRRLIWQSRRRNIFVNYILNKYQDSVSGDDLAQVMWWWRSFYDDVEGPLQPFVFYFPTSSWYYKEFCGTAVNDTTETIYLPSRNAKPGSFVLYKNGIALTPGDDYVYWEAMGPENGDDYVLMDELPATGDKFHWTFNGRLKIWARLAGDIRHVEQPTLYNSFTVELVPLQPTIESTPI